MSYHQNIINLEYNELLTQRINYKQRLRENYIKFYSAYRYERLAKDEILREIRRMEQRGEPESKIEGRMRELNVIVTDEYSVPIEQYRQNIHDIKKEYSENYPTLPPIDLTENEQLQLRREAAARDFEFT